MDSPRVVLDAHVMAQDWDARVRNEGFLFLEEATARHGDVLSWQLLQQGMAVDGVRVPLVSMQGIFKPKALDLPLTIRTAVDGPYSDELGPDGMLRYAYERGGPQAAGNAGLRELMRRATPLVYLFGIDTGRYLPWWPVFVVDDHPDHDAVTVSTVGARSGTVPGDLVAAEDVRRYRATEVLQRVHQARFRTRVLGAYRQSCAMCRLRHADLLDAAHILADRESTGTPVVPNGLSLCKLHHAAFDRHLLGIRPDMVVEVSRAVLDDEDGPMLQHGLQGFHGQQLVVVPRRREHRPDPERLEQRYEAFRAAS